jgi:hypothetical protein
MVTQPNQSKLDSEERLRIESIREILNTNVIGKWVACHDDTGHYYRHIESEIKVPSVTTQNIIGKPHLLHWATRKAIEALRDDPMLLANYLKRERELEALGRPAGVKNEYLLVAQNAYIETRDDAASVGTLGHNLIERYIKLWMRTGIKPDDIRKIALEEEAAESRAIAVARSAEKIFSQSNIVPLGAELLVGSYEYQMAGTLDFLCYNLDTHGVELWDWKSTNMVDDDYARQVAAYKMMLLEMCGDKFNVINLRIMKLDKWSDNFKPYLVVDADEAFQAQLANNVLYRWKSNGKPKLIADKKRLIL